MKIVEFYIDPREGTVRKSAAIAHPNTYSWRVRRTQAGFFGGLLKLRFRDRELWRKGTETRLVPSIAAKTQNKSIAGQKGVFFFLHVKGKKMDLFVWLLGCLLAFLWSSSVKGEEGGKFDTFLPTEVLTVNRPFSSSS